MSDAAALLQQLGFGDYEARAYIALLQRNPVNGYELAKTSGIPRANIYDVLRRLEERNAVISIQGETSVQYAPIPPSQLIPQMELHLNHVLGDAQRSLESLAIPLEAELSRNIMGYPSLLDQARALIDGAKDELFIALWHPEAEALAEAMAQAEQRGIRLTTLCLQACPAECMGCKGAIYRYRVVAEHSLRWLIVVRDNRDLLLGEIGAGQSVALRTGQQSIIQMTVQYVQSSIAWAALLSNTDPAFEQRLPTETQRILRQIGPTQSGWLSHMRALLEGNST
jgi:HTH-type transcriptional regulator, sugar sensing transcriptional regulator